MMMRTGDKKQKESQFQKDCKRIIKEMGGYVIKIAASAYQSTGDSDLICCYKGRFIAFELKVEGNKPSALQLERIEDIKRAGGIAKPIYNIDEIKETLYEISRIQQGDKP